MIIAISKVTIKIIVVPYPHKSLNKNYLNQIDQKIHTSFEANLIEQTPGQLLIASQSCYDKDIEPFFDKGSSKFVEDLEEYFMYKIGSLLLEKM